MTAPTGGTPQQRPVEQGALPYPPIGDVVKHHDETVHHDTARGHIRIGDLTFADLGNATLSVWAHQGCTITPTAARDLAAALNAWAARWPS